MNKYEILENIGQGEYGVVLKALNKETDELVAIKKFKEDDSQPQNKRVILREVKILKTLNHANIIQLKQAFRRKGKIYLVCEYVEKNLLEILQETPLTPHRVKNFTYQLLKGICYMHNLNILHRDIKPQNLLISKSDQVKICDLGFARSIPNNKVMTDYVATRWYRPPELLIGKDSYDKSIDLWSVGCVMAEMIDGEPLFGGENDLDQLYLIQKCLGPLISTHKEFFLKNPKFVGMKFPEVTNSLRQIHAIESIDRRYFGKIDKTGLDLMKKMLKMDPEARITAEQALNHPYFNRLVTPIEREPKKSSIIEGKNAHLEKQEKGESGVNKSHLYVNNFLQQKSFKNGGKDDKIGINKVTGFSKGQKYGISQMNQNMEEVQSPWVFAGKGKSLGKKPNAEKVREKEFLNEKYSRVKCLKEKKVKNEEDEYAEEWEEDEQEKKTFYGDKSDRKMYLNGKQEEKSIEKKKMKKLFKKDNVNIVFNQNTYNLNFIDQPNAH